MSTESINGEYHVWVDGSAIVATVSLGAGWLVAQNGKLVQAGTERIRQTPLSNDFALFAETKAAILGLRSLVEASNIKVFSDRPEIRACINSNQIPDLIAERKAEIIPTFETLLYEMRKHSHVRAYSPGSRPGEFSRVAHDVAHNLAAKASGAHTALEYPALNKLFRQVEAGSLMLQRL